MTSILFSITKSKLMYKFDLDVQTVICKSSSTHHLLSEHDGTEQAKIYCEVKLLTTNYGSPLVVLLPVSPIACWKWRRPSKYAIAS